MNFTVNERLTKSSIQLAELSRCYILLKNESSFPWLIVVPQVDQGIEDLHHLPLEKFDEVMRLIRQLSLFVDQSFKPEKLNIGCIGNQVRQMHIHIIGRKKDDQAWPNVVWGTNIKKAPYKKESIERIQSLFNDFVTTNFP